METLTVGLCGPGRHAMPVEQYIFPAEINPLDFDSMDKTTGQFLIDHVGLHYETREALNQSYEEDVPCFRGNKALVVYVTGLSAALAAVITACAYNGVPLTLMHYDSSTGEYKPQELFV